MWASGQTWPECQDASGKHEVKHRSGEKKLSKLSKSQWFFTTFHLFSAKVSECFNVIDRMWVQYKVAVRVTFVGTLWTWSCACSQISAKLFLQRWRYAFVFFCPLVCQQDHREHKQLNSMKVGEMEQLCGTERSSLTLLSVTNHSWLTCNKA